MIAADVAGHPPLHEWAECRVGGRLHDQVEMIGHEAEANNFDRVLRFCRGEQVDERGVVTVLVEDRRATVPAIEHMVGVSGYLSAWNTRHERSTVRQTGTGTQEKVTCPLFLPGLAGPPIHDPACCNTVSSISLTNFCLAFGKRLSRFSCRCNFGVGWLTVPAGLEWLVGR